MRTSDDANMIYKLTVIRWETKQGQSHVASMEKEFGCLHKQSAPQMLQFLPFSMRR